MRKKLGPCRILHKNTAPDRSKSHQTLQSLEKLKGLHIQVQKEKEEKNI
jgi:hypothetical protein